ncbi:MAG: DsrE family protein [Bacteroidetes bacterium]|nr:DsrE family protein [Bacteroidota bacterium]
MKYLIIINDAPYGTEKAYNALRLAMQLQKESTSDGETKEVRIFLMADAATCALPNQNTPAGYYNIERMLKSILNKGGHVRICGTCADARGIKNLPLIEGAQISTMAELAAWTVDSDKVITF